jgi:membrane-associated phospholipid phosphatase
MVVTVSVVAVALLAGLLAFAASAGRALDLDATQEVARHPRARRFLAERFDRETRRGLLVTISFAIVFAVALVVGVLLDMVRSGEGIAEADDDIASWGSRHASSEAVEVLRVITQLGSTVVVTLALAATALFAWLRRRSLEPAVFLAIVGVGQAVLAALLKLIVDRPRPDVQRLVAVTGPSFPSGHATAAAACWTAVALVLAHGAPRLARALLLAIAVVLATAVAASRALLGVHWLTDILGGLALGWGWVLLVTVAFRTRVSASPDRRRPAPSCR